MDVEALGRATANADHWDRRKDFQAERKKRVSHGSGTVLSIIQRIDHSGFSLILFADNGTLNLLEYVFQGIVFEGLEQIGRNAARIAYWR